MKVPRPIPYPPDTRAKGWRFELDLERVRQSDTWTLAKDEGRPWLLMMWAVAWEQTPCGSYPDDDMLIAARLGMPDETFARLRRVLLRGWWKATDGRLYHDTLVERVQEMNAIKNKERVRKAAYRSRMDAGRDSAPRSFDPEMSHGTDMGQGRDNHGTDAGQPRDSHGSDPVRDDTGTRTGTYIPPSGADAPPPPAGGDDGDGKPPKKTRAKDPERFGADFDEVLMHYPKRPGASRKAGLAKYTARREEGVDADLLLQGVKRYAAHCRVNRTEPQFVKTLEAFFGPMEHYRADWTPIEGSAPAKGAHRFAAASATIFGNSDDREVIDV